MKIKMNANSYFRQNVELKYESGLYGLEIESQGGNSRNLDYRAAVIAVIKRLKSRNIEFTAYYNSVKSKKNYSNISDRKMIFNFSDSTEKIKSSISKSMIDLGGASNSCLFIHSHEMGNNEWMVIINDNEPIVYESIISGDEFDEIVDTILQDIDISNAPLGILHPELDKDTGLIKRDPYVKAFVLTKSNWICEHCNSTAPFIKKNGNPYLEVHHVKQLAHGGSDRIQNMIALCPNCHRQFHYGIDQEKMNENIYFKIGRLIKE